MFPFDLFRHLLSSVIFEDYFSGEVHLTLGTQMAVLPRGSRAIADSKYNIAELLESYILDDQDVCVSEEQNTPRKLTSKSRARSLYLDCEKIYCELYGPDNEETIDAAACAARCK